MKKALAMAAATLAALTHGQARAQSSVTMYGVVDAGIEYLNRVPNTAKQGDSLFRMTSGNIAGSRWGMRGVEDLGGGLKGVFVLEGGMVLDTGASSQGGRIFG